MGGGFPPPPPARTPPVLLPLLRLTCTGDPGASRPGSRRPARRYCASSRTPSHPSPTCPPLPCFSLSHSPTQSQSRALEARGGYGRPPETGVTIVASSQRPATSLPAQFPLRSLQWILVPQFFPRRTEALRKEGRVGIPPGCWPWVLPSRGKQPLGLCADGKSVLSCPLLVTMLNAQDVGKELLGGLHPCSPDPLSPRINPAFFSAV